MTNSSTLSRKKVDFYKRPFKESITLLTAKLSGSTYRIIEFMSACCTFAEEVVFMPPAKQLAEILNMGLSTVYKCLDRIEEKCPFLQFKTNSEFIVAYRIDPNNPKFFLDFKNLESLPRQKNQFQKYRNDSHNLEKEEVESLAQEASEPPQTLQIVHTPQTGVKDDLKNNTESNKEKGELSQPIKKEKNRSKNSAIEENISADVAQLALPIPPDILKKLREIEVEPTEQVIQAIKKHHISQVHGAIAHIENTWETIRNPLKIFLYQLPKQPIEKMGTRYRDELIQKTKQEIYAIELEQKTPEYQKAKKALLERVQQLIGKQKK